MQRHKRLTKVALVVIGAVILWAVYAVQPVQTMPQDDKLDTDAEMGAKDVAAQARRFNRVAEILVRAAARYQQISDDLGAAGPSPDPAVQAALQTIDNNAQSLINKVLSNPGPVSDPEVLGTVQAIARIGAQLLGDANSKLPMAMQVPCPPGTPTAP